MSQTEKYKWAGKSVLIVEDITTNYTLISKILEPTQARCIWAKNGEEAITLFNQKSFDIILMDIRMPVKNGHETTKEIKSINEDIPIVAQTAYVLEEDKSLLFQYGYDDLITKPIERKIFLETLEKFLK